MKYLYKLFVILFLLTVASSCSDFLNPSTEQNKTISEGIQTMEDLRALMDGVYNEMSDTDYYGRYIIVAGDVRSSNAFSTGRSGRFLDESKLLYPVSNVGFWDIAYQTIANTNLIINSENVPESPEVNYIRGQAYTLRALSYMNLLINYGQAYVDGSDKGIPYITTYNEGNFYPSRGSVQDSWGKIRSDFEQGVSMMTTEFDGPTTTLTYYGARALQARFYLTIHDFEKASTAAKDVIDNGGFQVVSATSYLDTWNEEGSSNPVFEIDFSESDNNGSVGHIYQRSSYGDVEVTPMLYKLYESDDVRRNLYIVYEQDEYNIYRMAGKFPTITGTENNPVIRYPEVVLTYAEAQAEMGNQNEAKKYLDMITSNRNASDYSVASVENIRLERRKELAMEGLRFLDLIRTGQGVKRDVPVRNTYDRNVPFGSYRLAFPIPQSELDANSSLTQNEGY